MAFNASLAVLMAAKFCRQFPLFQWREEALPEIGRRADKFTFRVDLANLRQDRCGELVMTLLPAQQSFLNFHKESTLYKVKSLLVTMKHPYILPTMDIYYSKEKKGLLVIQQFVVSGSIKDRIYGSDPARPYKDKYRLERATPLAHRDVARWGRQVLEALQALRSKGFMCEHLSTGNILIEDGNARISDLYTPLLAIDRHAEDRECTVPLEAKVDIDILRFGHVLYEMATGLELNACVPDPAVLEFMAPEIADVLWFIFYPPKRGTSTRFASESTSSREDTEEDQVLHVEDEDEEDSISEDEGSGNGQAESTSGASSVSSSYLVDIEQLLAFDLFANADVPRIETLFSGFRFDSSMKSTVKHSMRINASRNQAYVVQHRDREALLRARQRAERRVHDERDKQERRAQESASARLAGPAASQRMSTQHRRKNYRAKSFTAPVDRRLSATGNSTSNTTTA